MHLILSLIFSGYTIYKVFTLPGQAKTISGGAKVEKACQQTSIEQIDKGWRKSSAHIFRWRGT